MKNKAFDLLYDVYFRLPLIGNSPFWLKVFRKVYEKIYAFLFNKIVLSVFQENEHYFTLNRPERNSKIVVSLTTIPERIEIVWISIESIFRQTVKPDKVILYLGKDKFKDTQLPPSLLKLVDKGLTISYCEDLKPHTKYFYALADFNNCTVITVDDDVIYPSDTIANLVNLSEKFPGSICANRAHYITSKNGLFLTYRSWIPNYKKIKEPSHLLMQTGVGGVLYPPNCLDNEVFNKLVFSEICANADDIWLKGMALKSNTKICTNSKFNKDFITIKRSQVKKLSADNVFGYANDLQFNAVMDKYKLHSLLLTN